MSSVVSTQWVCGNSEYEWELTPTVGLPFPFSTETNFPSRFMRIGNLNGVYSGGTTFNVRIRPWFRLANGAATPGLWGPSAQLCIVGPTEVDVDEVAIDMNNSEQPLLVSIFPNPINDHLLALTVQSKLEGTTISIYDVFGRLVYASSLQSSEGRSQVMVPLPQSLAAGLYTLLLGQEKNVTAKAKFLVR
jgi:hypothetical protein